MNPLFVTFAVIVTLLMLLSLYRTVRGPTVFDRTLGAGVISTKGLILLCLIGFAYYRIDLFVDLARTYALLNFIGTVVLAKYFERRTAEGGGGRDPRGPHWLASPSLEGRSFLGT